MADISNYLSTTPLLEINEPTVEKWAHTQSKKQQINFTWTINNFSFRQKQTGKLIKSPTFSADSNDEIKWCLDLYPKGYNEDSHGHLSIYLHLLSEPKDKSEVLGKLRICILNIKPDKTKESKFKDAQHFQLTQSRGFFKLIQLDYLLDEANGFLPDDKLTIFSEVSFVCGSIIVTSQKRLGQFKIPERKLAYDFGSLLDNHKLSDVRLVVGEHEFPAHKAILAARSDVFAAMFEHEMQENKLNRVNITDVDHEVLQEMLLFIYTGYAPKIKLMADHLLAAADKYALTELKVLSEEAIFAELSIETATETLILADVHSAEQLKEQTIHFINNHAKEIITTDGWQKLVRAHSPLIADTFEALFKPTKEAPAKHTTQTSNII